MRHQVIVGTLAFANHLCFALVSQCAIPHQCSPLKRGHKRKCDGAMVIVPSLWGNYGRSVVNDSHIRTSSMSLLASVNDNNDDVTRTRQTILGQAKRRLEKSTRREDRIHHLETSGSSVMGGWRSRSDAENAELAGLLLRSREIDDNSNFVEKYDPRSFNDAHVEFKRLHNEAFVALARYCHRERNNGKHHLDAFNNNGNTDSEGSIGDPNVFYLDGPDASTSSTLIDVHGFNPRSCYVANRHKTTCDILQRRVPSMNLIHAPAVEALMTPKADRNRDFAAIFDERHTRSTLSTPTSFSTVNFAAYYFDGCGGYPPHVVDMMSAALLRLDGREGHSFYCGIPRTTAVGYSLMGGNRDVVDKELDVCRALSSIASTMGMRTRHVLDDPVRYGVPRDIVKTTTGGTFTSWMLLEDADG